MTRIISMHRLCRAMNTGKQKDVTYILYNNLPHSPLTDSLSFNVKPQPMSLQLISIHA